jgi:hypothetical protein
MRRLLREKTAGISRQIKSEWFYGSAIPFRWLGLTGGAGLGGCPAFP